VGHNLGYLSKEEIPSIHHMIPSNSLESLLQLSSLSARQAWLVNHYPQNDDALIRDLWESAEQRERSDPHTLTQLVECAKAMAVVWHEPQMEAVALRISASMCRALGDHTKALRLYESAIDLYRTHNLATEAAKAAVGPIDTLRHLGEYAEALELAEWAIAQIRTLDDPFTLGKLLVNQGNIYARLADFSLAQQVYAEARTLLGALGYLHHVAVLEVNEANVLTNLNQFRQAEPLLQQARTYFADNNMSSTVARIDHNLAYLYFTQGDYQRALITFDSARELFEGQENQIDIALVDLYRSDIYLALNLYARAITLARDARAIFETAQMPWETGQLWLNEAVALAHSNEAVAANRALSEARQIFTHTDNSYWLAITDLYQAGFAWQFGQLSTANEYLHRAYKVFQQLSCFTRVAQCRILFGEMALNISSPEQAIEEFTNGLASLQGTDLPAITFACHHGLGRAFMLQEDSSSALKHYRRAIADIERLQTTIVAEDYKIAFSSDKLRVYEEFIVICLQVNASDKKDEIFMSIQRIKSRVFAETLAEGMGKTMPGVNDELYTEIDTIQRELNWYYNRLYFPPPDQDGQELQPDRKLRTTISDREKKLAELWQRWRANDRIKTPNLSKQVEVVEIQSCLPPGTLLLEFFTTAHLCIVFGITNEEIWIQQWELPSSDLRATLQRLQFYLDKLSYGPEYRQRHEQILRQGYDDCLYNLHQLLLKPLSNFLVAEQLIIAPHGQLHSVPFQALFDGETYLIEIKEVSYIPSATVLYRILTQSVKPSSGSPIILSVTEPTIPYVQVEIAWLAKLFPEAIIYSDEQATTNHLLTEHAQPPFLHISTHATFRSDNPRFSGLKLADGWLTINDLDHLTTIAPLVTLSACETGRNHVMTGDELIGIWRGFFQAGARSLLVGLWPVIDQTTAHFMAIFYRALLEGQSVSQAMRNAQLEMKVDYPHPYYWAPYMLIGDPFLHLPLPSSTSTSI